VRVSIIIPAYNAEHTLGETLEACAAQGHHDVEVLVVDDGSTDGTAAITEQAGVRFYQQDQRGPAAARNLGAQHAEGEVLAFTDSDCVPEPGWIDALLVEFNDGVVGVGGTYTNALPDQLLPSIIHEEIAIRHAKQPAEVDFLGSFNVAYLREAFEAVGGFDEAFTRASGEDNDLAYRLFEIGGRLRFTPKARVAHYHPSRLLPYLRTQARHGFWRVKLYVKHRGKLSGGDKYAGLPDLLAPPLLCATIGLGCLVATLSFVTSGSLVNAGTASLAVAGIATSLIHLPALAMALSMVRRTGDSQLFCFFLLTVARNVARGWGMLHGALHFVVLRRESA
jgi:glycosyltransferase involved in cell wall biosynthesis